jgi:hypothetical protein
MVLLPGTVRRGMLAFMDSLVGDCVAGTFWSIGQ